MGPLRVQRVQLLRILLEQQGVLEVKFMFTLDTIISAGNTVAARSQIGSPNGVRRPLW